MERTVLVTGGGSGIGRGIALEFAKHGDNVIVIGRHESTLRETCKKGSQEGSRISYSVCDVSDKKSVECTLNSLYDLYGCFDIVINSAGVINVKRSDGSQDDEFTMRVNYFGTLYVCEHILKNMVENHRKGAIINIGSIAGINGSGSFLTYSASKGAVISYSKGLARMYGEYGIRVNVISPGVIVTPMSYIENPHFDENMEHRIAMHPLKRVGTPEDIAATAYFLASEGAGFITGQNIIVDGGLTI